ncbi:uncharacterized protein LOC108053496 isoform X2 [Drosophila rhopaloa]|uniref:Uncharacterized protein LOC108053496 isoform X2 n=1 Tax=Drosophila rhopaloa TaxID=1041015 RepID=A0A6P4FPJ9_DRORH|nr:uncharacterized protein LOC108053496 isoform X2 [Drosophila rhopaloa]
MLPSRKPVSLSKRPTLDAVDYIFCGELTDKKTKMRVENGRLWGKLHDGKFEVRSVTKSYLEEALDVLDSSFFLNESVCIACEINLPENKQARLELRELCRITALDGVSLLVKEVETGRVVSVSFNKIQFTPPPGDDHFFLKFRNERAKSPQARRLMDFMIEVDEKIDVSAMYKMDCFCELMFLATLPSHERLGLGRSLSQFTIQLTQELAEGKGLEEIDEKLRFKRPAAVTAIWTSSFSQKVGKATNFKVLNSVLYSEFEYKGKRFSEIINPLHKFCEHVIYKL